jgi:hypothetical protein
MVDVYEMTWFMWRAVTEKYARYSSVSWKNLPTDQQDHWKSVVDSGFMDLLGGDSEYEIVCKWIMMGVKSSVTSAK